MQPRVGTAEKYKRVALDWEIPVDSENPYWCALSLPLFLHGYWVKLLAARDGEDVRVLVVQENFVDTVRSLGEVAAAALRVSFKATQRECKRGAVEEEVKTGDGEEERGVEGDVKQGFLFASSPMRTWGTTLRQVVGKDRKVVLKAEMELLG